jgi:hypothetical protein
MIQQPHFTEQKTKISITHAGNKFKAILPWDADIESVLDSLIGLLVAAGFHTDTIKEAFIDRGVQYSKDLE